MQGAGSVWTALPGRTFTVERTEAERCAVGIEEEVRVEINVRTKKTSGQGKKLCAVLYYVCISAGSSHALLV